MHRPACHTPSVILLLHGGLHNPQLAAAVVAVGQDHTQHDLAVVGRLPLPGTPELHYKVTAAQDEPHQAAWSPAYPWVGEELASHYDSQQPARPPLQA